MARPMPKDRETQRSSTGDPEIDSTLASEYKRKATQRGSFTHGARFSKPDFKGVKKGGSSTAPKKKKFGIF